MAESNPDKMKALTSENTLCLLALTVILLDSFTHALALQLLAGCVECTPVQDPLTYILLSFAPKSPLDFNSLCFAYDIFQYKHLFDANSGFGIPYRHSPYP